MALANYSEFTLYTFVVLVIHRPVAWSTHKIIAGGHAATGSNKIAKTRRRRTAGGSRRAACRRLQVARRRLQAPCRSPQVARRPLQAPCKSPQVARRPLQAPRKSPQVARRRIRGPSNRPPGATGRTYSSDLCRPIAAEQRSTAYRRPVAPGRITIRQGLFEDWSRITGRTEPQLQLSARNSIVLRPSDRARWLPGQDKQWLFVLRDPDVPVLGRMSRVQERRP
jgi:hypothetical protein